MSLRGLKGLSRDIEYLIRGAPVDFFAYQLTMSVLENNNNNNAVRK